MSTVAVYKYRLWCVAESAYVECWGESAPSTCPNNTQHSIDANSITIVDTILPSDPVNLDGRRIMHTTPRELLTYSYFTGGDDDHTDPHAIGGSSNIVDFCLHHEVEGDVTVSMYGDFNTINNCTYIRQGLSQWKDALNDLINFEFVPKLTDYTAGENTNYDIINGVIIPASGDGDVTIADEDRVLVEMVPNESGTYPAGYWDATWNTTNKIFENITPNGNGTGKFNMFSSELVLGRFGNRVRFLGSGHEWCYTDDITRIGHNMRIKITATTIGTDHEWWWNMALMLYRKKTC